VLDHVAVHLLILRQDVFQQFEQGRDLWYSVLTFGMYHLSGRSVDAETGLDFRCGQPSWCSAPCSRHKKYQADGNNETQVSFFLSTAEGRSDTKGPSGWANPAGITLAVEPKQYAVV
jgi:hypothetical protein